MMTGYPILLEMLTASSMDSIAPSLPGKIGVPLPRASFLHEILSPSRPMATGLGPMKTILHSWQTSANSALSARKPYPG